MPTNFFSFAWPLTFSIILLAGLIIILAALTTLVTAITRARQLGKEKLDQALPEGEAEYLARKAMHRPDDWPASQTAVLETATTDGIHYVPNP